MPKSARPSRRLDPKSGKSLPATTRLPGTKRNDLDELAATFGTDRSGLQRDILLVAIEQHSKQPDLQVVAVLQCLRALQATNPKLARIANAIRKKTGSEPPVPLDVAQQLRDNLNSVIAICRDLERHLADFAQTRRMS